MYILTYKLMGSIYRKHRRFQYLEDMNLFIKKLKPYDLLVWEEIPNE